MIYRVYAEVDVELEEGLDFDNSRQALLIVKAAKTKIANANELTKTIDWDASYVEGKAKWGCTTDLTEFAVWCPNV